MPRPPHEPSALLTLIDRYAAAHSARTAARDLAAWALVAADDDATAARAAVLAALDLDVASAPAPRDDVAELAGFARAREAAWASSLGGAS